MLWRGKTYGIISRNIGIGIGTLFCINTKEEKLHNDEERAGIYVGSFDFKKKGAALASKHKISER